MFMIANTKNMSIVQYTSADNTLMAAQKGCRYQRQFGVLISVLSAVISLWLLSFNMVDAALISKPPANLGLVGYWSMNENTGTVASDFSGNGNRGILTNGPTWVDGKRGKALNFDGVDDTVPLANLRVNTAASAKNTVSFWMYWKTGGGTVGFSMPFGFTSYDLTFYTSGYFGFNTVNSDVLGISSTNLANQSVHVVAVFFNGTPSATNNALYINGVLQTITQLMGTPVSRTIGGSVNISGFPNSASYKFNGLIDEVRIYNRALSATEIQALYKSGAAKIKFPAITRTSLTSGSEQPPTPPQSSWTTASITPSPNKLVLLAVGTFGSAMTVTSVTGNGLTWVKVGEVTNSGTITLFRAMGPAPTAGAVTITATANRAAWSVVEYGGVDTSGTNGYGAIVQSATGSNGYASSLTVTLAKFASATNAAYGATMFDNDSSVGVYPGSGFSTIHQPSSFSGAIQTEDKFSEDTTVDWTYGINVYNAGIAAEIKAKPKTSKINASQNSKITNGLVGMWSFNGPDLTTTTAYDRSGQGNNGTLGTAGTARLPLRAAGKLGQALDFASGGGDGGSYVDVGSPAILDNLPQVTVSAWIYPRSAGGNTSGGTIINKSDGAIPLNGWRFSLVTGGGATKILFFNVDYTTTDINVKSVDNTIAFNQWQHVAVSWTGSNNASDVRIYLNGMEVSYKLQTSAVGTRVSDAAQSFGVGDPGTGADFDGLIDEVRIYNRALSAGEVSALYNSGAAKVNASQNSKLTNGLVGMWSFNGPDLTTTTAYDRSGQGNNGTLTNGPTRAIGKIGQALSFDGVDDVVDAGSATNLDNLSAITFSAWILSRSEGEGGTGHIVSKYGTGGTGSGWRLKFGSGTTNALQFNVQYATTDLERYASNNTLQLNVWQHVVVTWDGSASASAARIYVNGAETTYQTTGNPVDARVDDNTNNLRLSPDEGKRIYNHGE